MSGVYEEKLFSEQLDRLLAGRKVQLEAAIESDLQTALDFAGKNEVAPARAFSAV